MSQQGPLAPATVADVVGPGSVVWQNTDLAKVSDGNYATALLPISTGSDTLLATGYGFSIPTGSTINGIQVGVRCQATTTAAVIDTSAQLYIGGVLTGEDKASVVQWPIFGADSYRYYGGPADPWTTTPSVAQINSSANFGFGISCQNGSGGAVTGGLAYVDFISITVYFTIAGNQVKQKITVVRPPQSAYDLIQRPD